MTQLVLSGSCILGWEDKCGVLSPFADAARSTFELRWVPRSASLLFVDNFTSRAVRQVRGTTKTAMSACAVNCRQVSCAILGPKRDDLVDRAEAVAWIS